MLFGVTSPGVALLADTNGRGSLVGQTVMNDSAVASKSSAAGWETGVLGLPVSDLTCGLSLGGCFAHFQNGSIYWTSTTGARLLLSPIRDKWGTTGWENGAPAKEMCCGLKLVRKK